MRSMPWSAAAVTSSMVSPVRLARSTPFEVGPQALDGIEVGGVGRQWLHDQPVPLLVEPGAHRVAAVGGQQPVPDQGGLLPAEDAAQPGERVDQRVGVVGVGLAVEGDLGAAAVGAVAQSGGHVRAFPAEAVA